MKNLDVRITIYDITCFAVTDQSASTSFANNTSAPTYDNTACVVVNNSTRTVRSNQPARADCASDGTYRMAITDGTACICSNQPACASVASDGNFRITITDGAVCICSNQPARADCASDSAYRMAITDGTRICSNQSTDITTS